MIPVLPELLERKLNEQYGSEIAEKIRAGFTHRRPVTLRVNTLKCDRSTVEAALTQAGIPFFPVSWYDDALILQNVNETSVRSLPLYEQGGFYMQGLSAMIPALVMEPKEKESILDMAAAPGGKTTQMAALSQGQALITACERDPLRSERLRFNLQRQGAGRVNVMNQDARQLSDFFRFDKILLDAPCTGSGTVLLLENEPQRRMEENWVKKTVSTQTVMLKKALKILQKGHEMVYSTCSVLRDENEQVLSSVLSSGKAELVPLSPSAFSTVPFLPVSLPGTLCVCPTELYEGFFVAKIRKLGD